MVLKILKENNPILRQPTKKVVDFDHELQTLIDNMVETMRKFNGIGLSAPQVGISKKIFICEFEGDKKNNLHSFPLTIICNPRIKFSSKKTKKMVEGCLSFPCLEILVERPKNIVICGQDRYGKDIEIKANDLYAKVLQHENDHLNSTLLIDHLQEIKTIFIGTGSLGAKTLKLLISDKQYNITAVITGERKIISRKKTSKENTILKTAKKYKIPVIITKNIKDQNVIKKIKTIKPDLGIMADFGQIIPESILNIFRHGIINIHPSLLPKHRGPSPIQQTILDGDKVAGVTLILTSNKMDAGGIISHAAVELSHAETSSTLKDYLGEVGATLVLNSVPYYISGDLKPIPQKKDKASYTKMFKVEDGFVDKNTKTLEVERKIRAFDVWPKVYTIINDKRIQISAAHFEEDGKFVIDRVKPEGKNEMTYEEYLRGYKKKLTFR